MKKDFNTKSTYGDDDKHIKTRIKTYKDSITTNFYNKKGLKKVPEEKIPHKCLSILILDSVIYAYEHVDTHVKIYDFIIFYSLNEFFATCKIDRR